MRIRVILVYFERYKIVRNALQSIKESDYSDWELAFIDDGSVDYPGEPIVREILGDHLKQIQFYNTHDTVEDKYRNGGSRHGDYMTQATLDSAADISFVLCDDDALTPHYLTNISKYFEANPDKHWGYSHVIIFDPTTQDYHTVTDTANWYNRHTIPVNPCCALDSSQIVYRSACIKDGIRWPCPQTGSLDAHFFELMHARYGMCEYMGCVGQYKGVFADQMCKRKDYTIAIH